MKIVMEARALSGPGGGIRTYVRQLQRLLPTALSEDDHLTVLADGPSSEVLLPWWLHWQLPRTVRKHAPDVVHYTKAAVPGTGFRSRIAPTVVTIYDVIPLLLPSSQKMASRLVWPHLLTQAAHQSDHIMTISECSKRDIVTHLGVSSEKVTVTPLVVDMDRFRPLQPTSVEKPYILFVGTIEPRKNVPLLLRAFGRIARDISHDLVIAGRMYKGEADMKRELAKLAATGLAERVVYKEFVPDDELPTLYAHADLFVWPSVYEGWGFPPQEAMASGVPVIVSDGGSLPEVVGDVGQVVPFTTKVLSERTHDSGFEQAFADAIVHGVYDAYWRQQQSDTGRKWVQAFSWQQLVTDTVAVYRRLQ